MPADSSKPGVFQLRYISTLSDGVGTDEVPRILEAARRINRRNGVTGLLLFNGERFLQILEGDEQVVRATFERISGDPRHRGIAVLGTTFSPVRAFAEWDMAYEPVHGSAPSGASLVDMVASMVSGVPDRIAREFISYARLKPSRKVA